MEGIFFACFLLVFAAWIWRQLEGPVVLESLHAWQGRFALALFAAILIVAFLVLPPAEAASLRRVRGHFMTFTFLPAIFAFGALFPEAMRGRSELATRSVAFLGLVFLLIYSVVRHLPGAIRESPPSFI